MNASPFDSHDPTAPFDAAGTIAASGAYLILRSGTRWSDVFRLTPPEGAVIGRASANEIVIRTDQASRRHASINWDGGQWILKDLGSRNGTYLNGTRIDGPHPLDEGDAIQIAGFVIQFSRRIDAQPVLPAAGSVDQATDDQMTLGVGDEPDVNSITDRRRHSRYLSAKNTEKSSSDRSHELLQLAFSLARAETPAVAVESTLDQLAASLPLSTVGLYVWDNVAKKYSFDNASLIATRQKTSHSYRRPPASLVESSILGEEQAILARNISGDATLASHNTDGDIDVESLIIAPIRQRDAKLIGFVHLTTDVGQRPLDCEALEFVVAAADILAESIMGIADRQRLSKNLRRSRRQVEQLKEQLGDRVCIIGDSSAIQSLSEQISLVGPTNATVLIRGESGVGKELVAAAVHQCSPRRDGPMLCINCAALSPTLLESELFGHEKGAFTGATDRKLGKFEAADGGTLLLDEIGEMSAETQAKFLRVLEGHKFERVGGSVAIQADVRVVAATNRDLQAMVREGTFRQDLYYRLHVVELLVPPLRARGDDCFQIAEFFLDRFNREMNRRIECFSDDARQKLLSYDWPGNVRELKNVIERAVVLNTKTTIQSSDLLLTSSLGSTPTNTNAVTESSVEITLAEMEQLHIERVLRHTSGNKSRAASILGIERSTLDRKLKKYT